jgi:MFS family permease
MILAPLSEFYGRRPIYLVSFACFTLLLLPCALAPNIAVLLLFRFFTGMAGSAFLSVAGGTVGDMFSGRELGAPMMIYTASPVGSPPQTSLSEPADPSSSSALNSAHSLAASSTKI